MPIESLPITPTPESPHHAELKNLFTLLEYKDKLSYWDTHQLNTMVTSVMEQEDLEEETPRTASAYKKERDRILNEWKKKIQGAESKVTHALSTFPHYSEIQALWKERTGEPLKTVEEATTHASELFSAWKGIFQKKCALIECHKDATGTRAKNVAWDMTGIAPPATAKQQKAWKEFISELEVLPGPHHTALSVYKGDPNAATAYALIHCGALFDNSLGRGLEIDHTKEDAQQLDTFINSVEEHTKSIVDGYPKPKTTKPKTTQRTSSATTRTERTPERTSPRTNEINDPEYQEMRELFGENMLGIEEVERAFTLQSGESLVRFTEAQKQHALTLLHEKLHTPQLQRFLESIRNGEHTDKFYLVLRVNNASDTQPITLQTLKEQIALDLQSEGQGELLYSQDWYDNKSFYNNPDHHLVSKGGMEWVFVTKDLVAETQGKTHTQQTTILQSVASNYRIPGVPRRRTPYEVVYDHLLLRRNGDRRLFNGQYLYDWTDTGSSDDDFVYAGSGGADGLSVDEKPPSYSRRYGGSSLSC